MFTRHLRQHSFFFGLSVWVLSVAATAEPAVKVPATSPPAPVGSTKEPTTAATSGEPFTAQSNSPTAQPPAAPPNRPAQAPSTAGDPWGIAPAPSAPPPSNEAPPAYYVEPVPAPTAPPPRSTPQPRPTQISPIQLGIEAPPPPPVPRHIAPRTSFWAGARAGWWIPFGDLWGSCNGSGSSCSTERFSSVASSGPMMEIDVGARVARNYTIYGLWERAQLGRGDSLDGYSPIRAETDYVALGVRLSADPDDVGLLLDLSIGARRFRAIYEGKNELQLTHAPLESRLGLGVDIRLSPTFSLSPLATLGLGGFGKAEWVTRDTVSNFVPQGNDKLTHGWFTLQLGGHFDIAGSR